MTTQATSRFTVLGPASVLLLTALLSACNVAAPAPTTPLPGTAAPATPGTPPTTQPSVLTPLGLLRITFNHIGADDASATAQPLASVSGQALGDTAAGLQLVPVSSGSFVTGTRGAGGTRYLYASFKVRNASAGGVAYATPRSNVTLLAVTTPSTLNNTALSSMLKFDGSAADATLAQGILPTHAMTVNRATDAPQVLPGGEDLQLYSEAETTALGLPSGVTRVLPYGFVVRNPSTPGSRTLTANPGAAQFDGVVTIAMKLPLQASAKDDVFTFSLNVEAVDDSVTRVSESVEEQGSSGAATRAALLGPGTQVATLCGTAYSGANDVFVGSVTTAGGAALDRQAHLGGNLALGALNVGPYAVFGNTASNVPTSTGLLSNYHAYPPIPGGTPATLSAASTAGSTPGSTATINPDGSFTFTPKVGEGSGNTDTLAYRVSDNAGCTSPALSAAAPITGRVWYVNNSAAAGGDGRSIAPFQSLASAATASSAGDTLYVARGSGTTTNQNAGVTLKANQRLIGAGVPLTLGAATLLPLDPAGSPTLGNAAGIGVTLASGNELAGLNIVSTGGAGVLGNAFGTLTTSAVSVAATGGPVLDLTNGVLNATFVKLSSATSTTHGLNLTDTSGTLTVSGVGSTAGSGGTISGALLNGVNVISNTVAPNVSLNLMNIIGSKSYGLLYTVPSAASTTTALTVNNSVLTDNTNNHLQVNLNGSGNATFTITNNTISNPTAGVLGGIEVTSNHSGGATTQGRVTGNTITLSTSAAPAVANVGIATYVNGSGVTTVQYANNTIKNFGTYGIDLAAQQGNGTLNATVSNNVINTPNLNGLEGMRLNSGNATVGEAATFCVNLNANTSAGNELMPGLGQGYVVRQRTGNVFNVQGYVGGAVDTAALSAFIKSRDTAANGARIRAITGVGNATCPLPTF